MGIIGVLSQMLLHHTCAQYITFRTLDYTEGDTAVWEAAPPSHETPEEPRTTGGETAIGGNALDSGTFPPRVNQRAGNGSHPWVNHKYLNTRLHPAPGAGVRAAARQTDVAAHHLIPLITVPVTDQTSTSITSQAITRLL